MAKVFAPFVIDSTIGNLTFYRMAGKNFVRKKSRLNRRHVLHSPKFERTRHFAGLMAQASKIGSRVYNELPEGWRQFWMYRAFTGEALTMLKGGRQADVIERLLWRQYVKDIAEKSIKPIAVAKPPKRTYRKKDTGYWKQKSIKAKHSKARKQLTLHYAGLLAQASQMASVAYRQLPAQERKSGVYHSLVVAAMRVLQEKPARKKGIYYVTGKCHKVCIHSHSRSLERQQQPILHQLTWRYTRGCQRVLPGATLTNLLALTKNSPAYRQKFYF